MFMFTCSVRLAAHGNQPDERLPPPAHTDNALPQAQEYEDGYPVDEPARIDAQVELARTVREYLTFSLLYFT